MAILYLRSARILQRLHVFLTEHLIFPGTGFSSIPPTWFSSPHRECTRDVCTDQGLGILAADWMDSPRSLRIPIPRRVTKFSNSGSSDRRDTSLVVLPYRLQLSILQDACSPPCLLLCPQQCDFRDRSVLPQPHIVPHPAYTFLSLPA